MSPLPPSDVPERFGEQLVATVTHEWVAATERAPWSRLTPSERIDHLPRLLRHLVGVVLADAPERGERAEMVKDAASHGEQRQTLDIDEEALLSEYYILRGLLWDHLREVFGTVGAEGYIARVDAALSVATAACMRGFHRAGLEAQGRWPSVLDELASDDDLPA